MEDVTGAQVLEAVSAMVGALEPHLDQDWAVPAGGLDWSCRATIDHIAHDLATYAAQFGSRSSRPYRPMDLTVRASASVSEALDIASAWGKVLGTVVDAAGPDDRAWHFGLADRGGFAAMGIGEILVHLHDITSGLGVAWRPPADLAAIVVARLLPSAPTGDPVDALLRQTGRVTPPSEPATTNWVWRAALA